ncbi:MAG: hypothetical protein JST53_05415 [Actinobacteria bacterium]|nr:hypothetical protein [Actinomycetota bacterium]
MPNLPDIPGKGLIAGVTNRTRVVVGAAGAGALAVGGFVARRLLGHDSGDDPNADPIAETPTAPPGAEKKPVPKPKPAKPKPPKADKPKPVKSKAPARPKPGGKAKAGKPSGKPKAPKPPKATGTDAPPKPEVGPGNRAGGKDPHHALNNPVVDEPDLTEYPDPYDTREDPLADPGHPTGAESTSEPPLQVDPEVENGGKPPRRENLHD